jgi:transaldolase
MAEKKLQRLAEFGQSIWLDNISRAMIQDGRLKALIEDGLKGMTSNPTIFDKSISGGREYDPLIKELHNQGRTTFEIYDELTVRDVQDAADMFMTVYEETGGLDGYVSLEINPELAMDTEETIKEGRRLHKKVNRPNVMFKVPSTDAGFEAISTLLSEGININVTLIFSVEQYIKTVNAYLEGMKRLIGNGGDPARVRSVASVFVSRIDTAVDKMIDDKVESMGGPDAERLRSLRGRAGVANSMVIYGRYREIFSGQEFAELGARGVNVQRVLWGSTGTKDPAYSDIKYVTELMGKGTINTLPDHTLYAFIDHGTISEALPGDIEGARVILDTLRGFGIDIDEVCSRLLDDGVRAFQESFRSLLKTIDEKKKAYTAA